MKRLLATVTVLGALAAAALPVQARADAYQRNFDKSVPAAGAGSLSVMGINGNVAAIADGGSSVRVHAVLKAHSADALSGESVNVTRTGSTVNVQSVCSHNRSFLFWSFADCDIEYEIHYPRSFSVEVHNANGNIQVSGSAALAVSNSNGNVSIDEASGNVRVSNKNGNLNVALAENWRGNSISLSTRAGNATLRVPRKFAATVTTHTRFGDVHDDANLQKGPVRVVATTTFGNVRIERE